MDDKASVSKEVNERQKKVIKWLEDFSEKLHERANDTILEVHGLLDQATTMEQELKNASIAFCSLSYRQFGENQVSEEDMTMRMMDEPRNLDAGVPAQNYETDILPRYREALLSGIDSYKNHLLKMSKDDHGSSVFHVGAACGVLPHIIGSEEYIHDNSCGLTGNTNSSNSLKEILMDSDSIFQDSNALFNPNLFGAEQGVSDKEETEPLASAALEFKAMLEAALLSPYKFYDEDRLSGSDATKDYEEPKHTDTMENRTSDALNPSFLNVIESENSECSTSTIR